MHDAQVALDLVADPDAYVIFANADDHIADLSRSGLTAVYRNLSYTALRSDTDEVFRFIWENLELLQIDPRFYIHVEHVRPSVRVGPDGIVVAETVAEYIQFLEGTPGALSRAIGLRVPGAVSPGTRVRVLGGGTIVFDEFGRAKYHHRKDIRDTGRQQRRLSYLVGNGLFDVGEKTGLATFFSTRVSFRSVSETIHASARRAARRTAAAPNHPLQPGPGSLEHVPRFRRRSRASRSSPLPRCQTPWGR